MQPVLSVYDLVPPQSRVRGRFYSSEGVLADAEITGVNRSPSDIMSTTTSITVIIVWSSKHTMFMLESI